MSHIVIDARIINSSTGTYVQKLLFYLQQIDNNNVYTILVPTKDLHYLPLENSRFHYAACDVPNYSFAEQITLKKQLTSLRPDLVHFCMPQQPIWYHGKTVTTFHDLNLLKTYNSDKNWLSYHFKQLVGRVVFQKALAKNQHVIVPSEFTKRDILETFHGVIHENRVTVTYEAAEPAQGTLQPFQHPFQHYILYVGQQSDYKNIKRLGDAHQQLLKHHPNLGLILVGKKNKSAKENERYFIEKGYKNILFTDFIPNEQRDWLYVNAAAYVFPSLMEGFGLPGLEAMTYNTPVISSNATCLPEIYGNAAEYFDPYNVTAIATAIARVIDDTALQESLRQRGRKQVNQYSWKKMAEQTLAIYMTVLNESSTSQPEQ